MIQNFSKKHSWKLVFYLTKIEFFKTIKHLGFIILTIVTISFLNSNFISNASNSNIVPTTGFFINQIAISEFPIILITLFFSGEIIWREKHLNISSFLDAYPIKDWVVFSSKIFTLWLIQAFYAVIIILFGVLSQILIFKYYEVDLKLYLTAVFGIHLIHYWVITVGFFFIQILSPNKYIGFLISGIALILILAMPALGLDNILFRYGILPDYSYSDMDGFNPFVNSLLWYSFYWLLFAAALFLLSFKIWGNGLKSLKFHKSFNIKDIKLFSYKTVLLILVIGIFCCGFYIHKNNLKGNSDINNLSISNYEKKYRQFDILPTPAISKVIIKADLYPNLRKVEIEGFYLLVNNTKVAIDTLLVSFLPENAQLILNLPNELIVNDSNSLGTYLYRLKQNLQPNDTITMEFRYSEKVEGFNASNPNVDLIKNGLLITNAGFQKGKYFPTIGYDRYLEIQDTTIRKNYGLKGDALGWKKLNDSTAKRFSRHDWVDYEAIISTTLGQTAVTNGTLLDSWKKDQRAYFKYKSDTIINNELAITSGKFEQSSKIVNGTNFNLFYHKSHSRNTNEMLEGMIMGIENGKQNGLKYPHKSINIVEIPNYHRNLGNAYSMPTLILWNEDGGFLNSQDKNDKSEINRVFSTAVHEVSHQWWPHIIKPAKAVEGGMVINETLAQNARLKGLSKKYGIKGKNSFIKQEHKLYFYERSAFAKEEPLIITSQAFVAYNKGSLVMNSISELIGKDSLDMAIKNYYNDFAYQESIYPTSKDLEDHILKLTPNQFKMYVSELFEKVIVFDLSINMVKYEKAPNNSYLLTVDIEASKFEMNSMSNEINKPFNGVLLIEIYNELGTALLSKAVDVIKKESTYKFVVDKVPSSVRIDPNMIYIDKNLKNNLFKIEIN